MVYNTLHLYSFNNKGHVNKNKLITLSVSFLMDKTYLQFTAINESHSLVIY